MVKASLALFAVLPVVQSYVRHMGLSKFTATSSIRRFCSTSDTPVAVAAPTVPVVTPQKADLIELMEIRIGKIIEINKHPEGDTLYVEKVDLGEPSGPRTIVSGLVEYCSIDYLLNKSVIVLCNLKPRALKGIVSEGMLLCVSNKEAGKVDPLSPPEDSKLGELITFHGHNMQPCEAGNKATKAYSKIYNDFYVSEQGIATYKGIPFMTSTGPILSTLKGPIS